jgi:hypothetical protein
MVEATSPIDADRVKRTWPSSTIVVGALVGSIGSVVFNRLVTHRLAPGGASDLRAVLGGLSAVGFLSLGVQLAIVGAMGRDGAARLRLTPALGGLCVAAALSAGAVAAIVIDSSLSFRLRAGIQVAIAVGAIAFSCRPRAELLQREAWGRLAILFVVGPAVRLLIGAALLSTSRPSLHLVPIVVGECAVAAATWWLSPREDLRGPSIPTRHLFLAAVASAGVLVMVALSSAGLRSRLGSDAEIFNDSATTARVVGFLPLAVSVIFFPRLARTPVGTTELRRAFVAASGWTLGLSSTAAAVILVAPSAAVRFVTGAETTDITVVRLLAIAAVITATAMVSLFVYIGHGSRLALGAWPVALLLVAGQTFTDTAQQLAVWILGCAVALAVGLMVPAFLRVQPMLHARSATAAHAPRHGDVTVVIPCYNPGPAVVDTIRNTAEVLSRIALHPAIIAVSDGSTDGSSDLIDGIDLAILRHVRHPVNRGKGAALRTGFALAHTEYVAFVDADGDLAPDQIEALLSAQQDHRADIVFGSKLHPASLVEASLLRKIYSSGYRWMIRLLFQLDIEDTQTGIKLYRRQVLDAVLPSLHEEKFALDLELFVAARAAGFETFVSVPVVLRRESGSTISFSSVVRMLGDTLRLFWRTKITLAYAKSTRGEVRVQDTTGDLV